MGTVVSLNSTGELHLVAGRYLERESQSGIREGEVELATVVIVGDGPGGLSAALFLAKAGHTVTVLGTNESVVHSAFLRNYLGVPDILGTEFLRIAKEQVTHFGAALRPDRVTGVSQGEKGFRIDLETGQSLQADYLVLTEGKNPALAISLGLDRAGTAIAVDGEYRSSMDRVYVVGRSARPRGSQAIISAGAGATAALNILSREAGKEIQDWDTPPSN